MAPHSNLRRNGVLLALSTPISGIISYAAVATLIGETRLEGDNGLTALGLAASALPLVAGLALIAWSFTDRPQPSGRTVAGAVVGLAFVVVLLGVIGLATAPAGDANIGGGLLVLGGIVVAAIGVARLRAAQVHPEADAPDLV